MKKMKKVIVLACAIVGTIMTGGCADSTEIVTDEGTSIVTQSQSTSVVDESDTEDKVTYTVTEESSTPLSIEEQVIYDQNDIKITAKSIHEDAERGYALRLLVENNRSADMQIYCTPIVNGFNIPQGYAVDYDVIADLYYMADAGTSTEIDVFWYSKELEASGIYNVGEIVLNLSMYDDENAFRETGLVVKTSKYEEIGTILANEGAEIFNQDGVRICARYVEESSFWGEGLVMYAENNTGKSFLVFDCKSLLVNDQQIEYQINGRTEDDVWTVSVTDNMKVISFIPFHSKKNDADYHMDLGEISKIEMEFNIYQNSFIGEEQEENPLDITTELLSVPVK